MLADPDSPAYLLTALVGLSGRMWGSGREQAENGCNGANTEPDQHEMGGVSVGQWA